MVGTATSPAKAADHKGKPTLHVECCTKQPEPLPRTVGANFIIFGLSMGSNSNFVKSSWQIELKDGSENTMLQSG